MSLMEFVPAFVLLEWLGLYITDLFLALYMWPVMQKLEPPILVPTSPNISKYLDIWNLLKVLDPSTEIFALALAIALAIV